MSDRKVTVHEWAKRNERDYFEKIAIGEGTFHGFGFDFAESETSIASFSTAIVEMPDGSVKNVPVELIVFNN